MMRAHLRRERPRFHGLVKDHGSAPKQRFTGTQTSYQLARHALINSLFNQRLGQGRRRTARGCRRPFGVTPEALLNLQISSEPIITSEDFIRAFADLYYDRSGFSSQL